MTPAQLWDRLFLAKRPSLSLGLFRFAVAFTVGCHMIPSFFHMDENYLSTAFKTKNFSFFPIGILRVVESSPDWVVWIWLGAFFISWASFTVGRYAQASCIVMTCACYYFYALNNYHIGTLSFDILLVTLFLMCVTNFHGDFLSLDSVGRGKAGSYKRLRPFFIQRLLQLQLVWTFWYTMLNKITAGGNWLTANPYYYLMRYPPIGVVRNFPLRGWLAQQPTLCYSLGIALMFFECIIPVLWLIPPPEPQPPDHGAGRGVLRRVQSACRPVGITLGILFHLMLWGTLHVPTIFLFLVPPMMLLFIQPEALVRWIEARQQRQAEAGRALLLYDGQCGFCLESVKRLRVLDVFGWVDPLDFHVQPDLTRLHPLLTPERCRSEMVLVEPDGRISGGFYAFRRMTARLPLLFGLAPLVRLPGVGWAGIRVYRWIATHRALLHRNPLCTTNQCALRNPTNGSN